MSPARIFAPLAIVACAIAVYVVVGGSDSEDDSPVATTSSTATTETSTKTRKATYTVRRGDTLGAIADRTGVEIDTIIDLNPALDPNSLNAGQKIRLRPKS